MILRRKGFFFIFSLFLLSSSFFFSLCLFVSFLCFSLFTSKNRPIVYVLPNFEGMSNRPLVSSSNFLPKVEVCGLVLFCLFGVLICFCFLSCFVLFLQGLFLNDEIKFIFFFQVVSLPQDHWVKFRGKWQVLFSFPSLIPKSLSSYIHFPPI